MKEFINEVKKRMDDIEAQGLIVSRDEMDKLLLNLEVDYTDDFSSSVKE